MKTTCNTQLRNNHCQQFQVSSHVVYTHGSVCALRVCLCVCIKFSLLQGTKQSLSKFVSHSTPSTVECVCGDVLSKWIKRQI